MTASGVISAFRNRRTLPVRTLVALRNSLMAELSRRRWKSTDCSTMWRSGLKFMGLNW